ncbi:monooxygenase [Aeromicrobium sp. Root495]|uniref:styrene monooxygenase subunit StyA n=1 Tax=Aeromicrobium sp. Root495 TaxID=1736550 RepID=UPI0006F4C144|nr:styrene monooxygenase/indole monooxygenase family protein [Aeromicrobium sp. Root495]KQY55704.1 monooxygenase [Aeromicrobium sp. Root495]
MSKKIGIIGAGTAGLHLGLYLRQHDVDVTIFTDKPAEAYASSRLPNTVAHHAVTIDRENALGVNHWDSDEVGYFGHNYYIGTPEPMRFYGKLLSGPSRAVDYRMYLPLLMKDFEERGGNLVIQSVDPSDLTELSEQFDLLVISTGKGTNALFPKIPELSPHTTPQRQLCVGIFKGIAQLPSRAVTMYFSPGAGEMIEIPTLTFNGLQNALVIENIPGGDTEILAHTKYDDDPAAFKALLLEKLEKHYPTCFERIDVEEFDLANSSLDILQGGVVPAVRETSTVLDNGRIIVALGDVQATVDPVLGQGANVASHAAIIMGEEIVANDSFGPDFVATVDARRNERVHSATNWTNFMMGALESFPPEFQAFVGALNASPDLADTFTDRFNYPEAQWDVFSAPERIGAFCEPAAV